MKKRIRIIFCSYRLQVINCVEYIYDSNSTEDINVLIVCNKENTARLEVNSTLHLYDWNEVIYLPPTFY